MFQIFHYFKKQCTDPQTYPLNTLRILRNKDVDNFDNFISFSKFYKFLTAHQLRELSILNMLQMFLSLQFLSFDSVNDELYYYKFQVFYIGKFINHCCDNF